MKQRVYEGMRTNGLAVILDESTAGTTYVGKAPVASSTADNTWQIMRIVEASGVMTITWADGNTVFDNVWNNRASLSYS